MPLMQRVVKAKTHRGKKFLEERGPKLIENCKRAIFIRGVNCNNVVLHAMKDFSCFKRPQSVMFNKKNDLKPFESASSLEFFAQKNDASLFMFGSHNKKRPNNLVIGRLFDFTVLDMYELGIENYKSLSDFKTKKIPVGTKPLLMFIGAAFENEPDYRRLKNLFIDFFRGPVVGFVNRNGFQHLLVFEETDGKIRLRSYRTILKKTGETAPDVDLEEIGPRMDMTIRRTRLATDDAFKRSCKKPLQLKPKKVKNIERDDLGTTHGRVHMERQDYKKLQTWKMKGIKRKGKSSGPTPNKKVKVVEPQPETEVAA